jgi:hypothetical protein
VDALCISEPTNSKESEFCLKKTNSRSEVTEMVAQAKGINHSYYSSVWKALHSCVLYNQNLVFQP